MADTGSPPATDFRASPAATADAVRGFESLSRADVAYAGGKGANLGELTAAGFPVPPGFVIGAPAYAAFCEQGGLRDRIEARLAGVDVEDTAALESAAIEVRSMVEEEPVPEWLSAAIREAYGRLAGDDAGRPRSRCAPPPPRRTPSRPPSPA